MKLSFLESCVYVKITAFIHFFLKYISSPNVVEKSLKKVIKCTLKGSENKKFHDP